MWLSGQYELRGVPDIILFAKLFHHLVRQGLVESKDSQRLAALFGASRAPVADFDLMLGHESPDLADHAGNVGASKDEQNALRHNVNVISVNLHDARLAAVEQSPAYDLFAAAFPVNLAAYKVCVISYVQPFGLCDVDAPFHCRKGRIDVVHTVTEHRLKHSLEQRDSQGFDQSGQFIALVFDGDATNAAPRQVMLKRTDPLGQFQIRSHRLEFAAWHERHIHGVAIVRATQGVVDLPDDLAAEVVLSFDGRVAHVRRVDNVGQTDQLRAVGWLLLENVQGCPCHRPGTKRLIERFLVNHAPMRDVDNPGSRLEAIQRVLVKNMIRLWSHRAMQADHVAAAQHFLEAEQLHAQVCDLGFRYVRIVGQNFHSEGNGAFRHMPPNSAQADQSQCFPIEFNPQV